jgi:hypothetical protein
MLSKELLKEIRSWIKDFERTQPLSVSIDEDTFGGSAYYLFQGVLQGAKEGGTK